MIDSVSPNIKQVSISVGIMLLILSAGHAHGKDLLREFSANDPSATATLGGIVLDEHDAVVPDASVSVTCDSRVMEKQVVTGSDGSFTIPQLPPGNYVVMAQRQGFATALIKDVALKGNDQLSLKIQLKVGRIGETVVIEAGASVVQKPPVAGLDLNSRLASNLPVNGRSLQSLITLSPGVVVTEATTAEQGQFSINGQRANANYFMVDGVSANIGVAAGVEGLGQSGAGALPGLGALGSTHGLVSLDAVEELEVQASAYAPEFGRMPGAQVLVTTRAGSDQYHGTIFEYFRNGALDANDWFVNRNQSELPSSSQHDFGGVLGGPVIKGRTFFFLSYEALSLRLPEAVTVRVPSREARAAAPAQLRPFLNAFPVPNGAPSTDGMAEFTASYTDRASLSAASLRIDQRLGAKTMLFGRYSHSPSQTRTRGIDSSPNTSLIRSFKTQTLTVGVTQIISPRFSHEFRFNYSRASARMFFEMDDFGGAVPFNDALIFPANTSRRDSLYQFSLGGNSALLTGKDSENFQRQINFTENLALSRGSHQLKFGIDYRRLTPSYEQIPYRQEANINGIAGALGGIASSVVVFAQDRVGLRFTNFSAYAQDSWRVSPRLNLTYGLRWEYNPPLSGSDGQELSTAQGLDDPATMTLAPAGTPFYQATYNNFAPRLGAAYQLFGKPGRETVLRAGFGLFYDLGAGTLSNAVVSFPHWQFSVRANVPYPPGPDAASPVPLTNNTSTSRLNASSPGLKLPLIAQWNVAIEHSLGSHQSLTASYVAAVGRRLLRQDTLINPNPNFSQVFVTTNGATSDYHALQLQFQRRLQRGLQALVSYTWSHSIDNVSKDSSAHLLASNIDPQMNRGPSDFDVRHSFAAALTYNIPSFGDRAGGHALLRNWTIDAIILARTPTPVDIFSKQRLGVFQYNFRPHLSHGILLYLKDPSAPGGRVINRAAFLIPEIPQQHGTLGRNALRGLPFSQVNFALHRRFALTERVNLQWKTEIFNLFNHPNFADPVTDLDSELFGRATAMSGRSNGSSVGLNPAYYTGGSRSFQLALKIQF